jgi:Fe-S-cluster containining protein
MTNGRLSRPERRALLQADARYLSAPFNMGPDPRSMAANLRRTVRLLEDRTSRSPCSDAVGHLASLFATAFRPHPQIACRKGCSYCCSQDVAVSAPEVFFAAAAIRKRPELVAAVLASHERLRGMSAAERLGHELCPLLENQACSIYESRPLACHGFVSVDLQACLETFVEHKGANVPMPQDNITMLYTARMMMKAALRLLRLDDDAYEFTPALVVVLNDPTAERRWLKGEKVFAQVKPHPPIPPEFDLAINQMAAHVAPTL